VLVTGLALSFEERPRGYGPGVLEPGMAYLAKPLTVDTLSARVRDVLDGAAETSPPVTAGESGRLTPSPDGGTGSAFHS
jgi:hypothetical protein